MIYELAMLVIGMMLPFNFDKEKKGFRGVGTIIMLLVLLLSLVTFAAILPALSDIISVSQSYTDSMTGLLIRLIPFFAAASILMIPLYNR